MPEQPVVESPTGTPRIPPNYTVPILIGAAVLMVVGEELSNPAPWTVARAGGFILKLVPSLMGILMPGWRR
jgi:hypothetical protein